MIAFVVVGCSKEEEGDTSNVLVGTKWQTQDSLYEIFYGGDCFDVYEFTSTSEVENYTIRNGNIDDVDGVYQYTLVYPNITIHKIDSEGKSMDLDFVFKDSRTMIRAGENVNEYALYMKYLKQ